MCASTIKADIDSAYPYGTVELTGGAIFRKLVWGNRLLALCHRHIFVPHTLNMVTACTLHKQHIFDSPAKLELLQDMLFEAVQAYEWEL